MSESPYAPPPAGPRPPANPARYVFMAVVVLALGGMILLPAGIVIFKRWLDTNHPAAGNWFMPALLAVIVLIALFVRLRAQRQVVQVSDMDARDALRKLGMAVDDPAAAETGFHAHFSDASILSENLTSIVIVLLGVTWSVLMAMWATWPFNALGALVVALGFAAMLYMITRYDQRWIELDGNLLRAEHFYTRRMAEWPVDDVQTVLFDSRRTRIQLRSERGPLLVNHTNPPMIEGRELVDALVLRLALTTQFAAQLREVDGLPLLSCVYHKGMTPPPPDKQRNGLLGLVIVSALMVGTGGAYQYSIDYDLWSVGAIEPHEMQLSELIAKGPGDNRHVIVTDFKPGVGDNLNKGHTNFIVPLFPTDRQSREIEALLDVNDVPDEDTVYALLQDGRANVVCGAERREWWGAETGPNLEKWNGLPLNSAWPLVEASRPPSEVQLSFCFYLAIGGFVMASLLSIYALWKSV